MKHLFPSLAAALLSLAHESRGQVFRLPNTSACQKSKRRSKKFFIETTAVAVASQSNSQIQTKLLNFPGIVHESRFGKSYHFSWLAAGRDTKMDWEGARNYCRHRLYQMFRVFSINYFCEGSSAWTPSASRPGRRMTG